MKAILIDQPGGAEQLKLKECAAPTCGPHDVLIQMKAIGVNYIDVYIRTGLYKPAAYPFTPGKEGSGIIIARGDEVKHLQLNDRVAFCSGGSGSYAELVAIPAEQVVKIPDAISFEIAAATMLQGLTAYYLTHKTFMLKEKQSTLVHAGAGGVGLLLIQMAKLINAHVITTVSSEEKAQLTKKLGADQTVIYTQESFLEKVLQYTNGAGVNVVYDSVGKTTFDDSLKALAICGMLVSFGQSSGPIPAFEIGKLAEKSLFLTRPSLTHYTMTSTDLNEMAYAVFDMISNKKLHITIGQRYALSDAALAHADLEARKTIGKSILLVG